MIKKTSRNLLFFLFFGTFSSALASHGALTSSFRDAWIDSSLADLSDAGLIQTNFKPFKNLTNLEVAQLIAKAGESLMLVQADLGSLPPLPGDQLPASTAPSAPAQATLKSIKELVEEYKGEMVALGVNIPALEERIYDLEHLNERLTALQREYLNRTGTDLAGYFRGYLSSFRGFGANALYSPESYNSIYSLEMDMKSVPAPSLLFNAHLRFSQTMGLPSYVTDPLDALGFHFDFRWLSLTSYNEYSSITAGDFFKHYTPLTLWNSDIPVYTFIEPTPYKTLRKDAEEWAFMDHGPDYRVRGLQVSTDVAWPSSPILSYLRAQVMAGPLQAALYNPPPSPPAPPSKFSNYFAGSQASISFFHDNLEFIGTGLLVWNDINSVSPSPYKPLNIATWPRQFQVGSVFVRGKVPFTSDVNLTGSFEYADGILNDDLNNVQRRTLEDWAVLGTGGINISGVHINGKYLNVGPYYYSPGAEVSRFNALPPSGSTTVGTIWYPDDVNGLDENIKGVLNRFIFQNQTLESPANGNFFAAYDRMVENVLPYGDATPNREALILGFSAEIGPNGWIQPQGSYVLQANEIQPNYIQNNPAGGITAVDGLSSTRNFGGLEGAITGDFSKLWALKDKTYQASLDFKHQTSDTGMGDPFTADILIGGIDFNIPFTDFDNVILSAGYEQTQTSGSEYTLTSATKVGSKYVVNPTTLSAYPFYRDITSNQGVTYTLVPPSAYTNIQLNRSSLAFGMRYPVNKNIWVRGIWIQSQVSGGLVFSKPVTSWGTTTIIPQDYQTYDRREQI